MGGIFDAFKKGKLLLLLLLVIGALSVVCKEGFLPHRIMWANDSPLGQLKSASARLPDTYTGHWGTDYWIGTEVPASSPTIATLLATFISPELYMKIFTPFTMVLLGFSAWLLLRQLGCSAMASIFGGLAAGLNMHFFSVACWGLGTWNICCAMIFLAFAAIVTPAIRQTWIKAALAGLAVGMSVMEGFDSGAILSVCVGIFVLFWSVINDTNPLKGLAKGIGTGAILVFFSVLIAASTLSTLVGTQIKGVGEVGQSEADKKAHWDFTTQWSVPKMESLRVLIPGLFGYRMIDYTTSLDKSGVYWGSIAEDSKLADLEGDNPKARATAAAAIGLPPEISNALVSGDEKTRFDIIGQILGRIPLQRRHSGNGEYAGVLVALMAIFALANSLRRAGGNPYSLRERQLIWFFAAAALFSLVAAWGRHGPLYALLYKLPYFSTIRNPLKFMHPFQVTWIILAGFGFEALYRCYLQSAFQPDAPPAGVKGWWGRTTMFDRLWIVALIFFVGASVAGYLMLSGAKASVVTYLQEHGFGLDVAPGMADFSLGEVAWYLLFLAACVVVLIFVVAKIWNNRVIAWSCFLLLTVIMACDLGRSDRPWVRYFDYTQKYSMNPIVDALRKKPWEFRVGAKLTPRDGYYALAQPDQSLGGVCHWWLENDFPYNNIQSVDIDQMPRPPIWDNNYLNTFMAKNGGDLAGPVRLWQLTNTRYILMGSGLLDYINEHGDPIGRGFQTRAIFEMAAKDNVTQIEDAGDLTPHLNDKGPDALVELTDALPRAKLFSHWETMEESAALNTLALPNFEYAKTVLVDKGTPVSQPAGAVGADAGTVEITDYNPKDVKLKAEAKLPSVLLLNERTAPTWHVWVDGKPADLLRCNYLMRGVFLTAGQHAIEFQFKQELGTFYITIAAFAVGIGLLIYLVLTPRPDIAEPAPAPPEARVAAGKAA